MNKKDRISFLKTIENKAGIYALLKDGHVFYVGISADLSRRLNQHLYKYGKDCEFMLLEEITLQKWKCLSKEHFKIEDYWISEFIRFGLPMKNLTVGGKREGSGRKKVPYTSIPMRIPLPMLDDAYLLINDFKHQMKTFGFYDESKAPVTQFS